MSDNKKPTESFDSFSRYMQQRLKEHRLQPDDDCWLEIESRIKVTRKSNLRKIGMVLAAAILALLLLMNIPWKKDEMNIQPIADMETYQPKAIINVEKEYNPISQPTNNTLIAKVEKKDIIKKQEELPSDAIISKDSSDLKETVAHKQENDLSSNKEDNTNRLYTYNSSSVNEIKPIQNKNKQSWLLTAGVGTGGSVSLLNDVHNNLQNDYNSETPRPPIIPPPAPTFGKWKNPEDFSEVKYQLPLSVGITLRKSLNQYIALESGLIYTYLASRFEPEGISNHEAKLGLHYLGIPVNLVVYLYNNRAWNIYLTGGFTAEKGLRSIYTQRQYLLNETRSLTDKTSIKGMQWSLNGSIGVSYRLYKEWSIYAEPKISYYFDSDQPISIRTDKPVTIGIGGGIRYEF